MPPLVTLTTDFGTRDPYVAAMKGVLHSRCPDADIVDLGHSIERHSIVEAALFPAGSAPYFPPGTIHVIVVDPGVGTARHPIAVASEGSYFVCPDNGVLTLFLQRHSCDEIRVISNPDFMLKEVSGTFHGRDIFAPAAAELARGRPFGEIGEVLAHPRLLELRDARRTAAGELEGSIVHIDRFGNCMTNIARDQADDVRDAGSVRVAALRHTFSGIKSCYGDVGQGEALVLWGSFQFLEIAVNGGSAAEALGLGVGDTVRLYPGWGIL